MSNERRMSVVVVASVVIAIVAIGFAGYTYFQMSQNISSAKAQLNAEINGLALASGISQSQIQKVEKAYAEGTLNIISSPQTNAILPGFEKLYPGITVNLVTGSGAQNTPKVLAAMNSSQGLGSVYDLVLDPDAVPVLAADNMTYHYLPANIADYPNASYDASGAWTVAFVSEIGLVYNTNMLNASQVPKTWSDLMNPKWHGLIGYQNAAGGGADLTLTYYLLTNYFHNNLTAWTDWMKAVGANSILQNINSLVTLCAQGSYPLAVAAITEGLPVIKSGGPVAYAPFGYSAYLPSLAITKGAAHLYAAELFIDYYLSDAAQLTLANAGYVPSLPSAASTVVGLGGVHFTTISTSEVLAEHALIPSLEANFTQFFVNTS